MASLKLGKMTIDGIISSELICVKNDKFRWDIDDVALSRVEASAMKRGENG